MRICLVTSELAPFSGWGVGTATAELARALSGAGQEVHILTDAAPALSPAAVSSVLSATLHILDHTAGDAALDHHPCQATRRPYAVHRQLRELHARLRFDAIHFNDFYADGCFALQSRRVLGEFAGAVLAVHLHSAITLLRRVNGQIEADLEAVAVEHLEVQAIRAADLLISPSQAMFARLGEVIGDLGLADRAVIPYAFDAGRSFGVSAGSVLPAPGQPAEVLFFGRLEWRKGAQLLAAASQMLLESGLDFRLRFVGPDTDTAPDRGSVRRWILSRTAPRVRDRFTFEENKPRSELVPLIRAAAACVVPSLWENFPNVCLEAMALGRPVIAADCGGIPEIIEHDKNGYLFRAGDSDSLAQVLRSVLTHQPSAEQVAAAAPARVRDLCDPAVAAKRTIDAIGSARERTTRTGSLSASRPASRDRVAATVPFYNLSAFLPETVDSLRAQTRPPDEIIIVDDGSTEAEAPALLDRYEREGIRIVRKPNGGLASARNAGFAATDARWVLPLDADDTLHPTFIERTLRAAASSPSPTVITAFMKCYAETSESPVIGFVPFSADPSLLPVLNTASSAIALLDRRAVLDAGGYDESFFAFEDWDLWCSLLARGARFEILPEFLIFNRIRPGSMLRSLSTDQYHRLRARLLTKHAGLSPDPTLTLRMMLAESMHYQHLLNAERLRTRHSAPQLDIAVAVRQTVLTTPRYRMADRLNESLKRLGIQPLLKNILGTGGDSPPPDPTAPRSPR